MHVAQVCLRSRQILGWVAVVPPVRLPRSVSSINRIFTVRALLRASCSRTPGCAERELGRSRRATEDERGLLHAQDEGAAGKDHSPGMREPTAGASQTEGLVRQGGQDTELWAWWGSPVTLAKSLFSDFGKVEGPLSGQVEDGGSDIQTTTADLPHRHADEIACPVTTINSGSASDTTACMFTPRRTRTGSTSSVRPGRTDPIEHYITLKYPKSHLLVSLPGPWAASGCPEGEAGGHERSGGDPALNEQMEQPSHPHPQKGW